MTSRSVVVGVALMLGACSSGSSDSSSSDAAPVTPADVGVETSGAEPVETDPPSNESPSAAPTSAEPRESTATEVTEPTATEPSDRPLVIDGPASVIESCDSIPRGVTEFELEAGGATHSVRIFMPETVIADPVPTVLNWHGLGSNGGEQAAFSGYETVAEQEGFAVVHATGVPAGDDGRNSWELAQFELPERDDLAFADALIDNVVSNWCADPARIYSTGMSNGGFFTSELVCHRSERIAAAVSVAGTSHSETCDPERAVPYAAFHGTDDAAVPYAGGDSILSGVIDAAGFFDQVMPEEFAEFAVDAGCDADPTRTDETPEVIRYDYIGCDNDVPMTFYELPGSGHTWPNSPFADQVDGIGGFTKDIDATVDGWAFMSQHSL